MKMQRTIVIRRDYLHYIRKYNRFEKRHKNMSVHLSPCFRCVPPSPPPLCSLTRAGSQPLPAWSLPTGHDVQTHDGLQSPPAEGLLTMPLARAEPWGSSRHCLWEPCAGWAVLGEGCSPRRPLTPPVSLQGRADWGHRDRGRVPPPQQDRALQRAQGDQGCRHQETVPEVLTPVGREINVGKVELPACELK